MSEESATPDLAELVRESLEAMNSGDVHWAVENYYSPRAVYDTAGYGMGTFEGREAIRGFLTEWTGSFEDLTIEADEVFALGNGVVLTVYHQEGRPIGGTNHVRVRSAAVSKWVEGLVARVTLYPESDIDEARAVAERLAEARG